VVLALWNPVDYFTRLLQPWANLQNGPALASRTLLLDLVSPLQPVILCSAARHREWPVVLASSVAAALTAVVSPNISIFLRFYQKGAVVVDITQKILSTGLLVIRTTNVVINDATFVKTAAFDSSLWNTSFTYGAESASLWSGIQRESLVRPLWTGDTFVIEPFELRDDKTLYNVTYRATSRGMYPGLNCEEAKFGREPSYWSYPVGVRQANVTYRSKSCTIDKVLTLADPTQRNQRQNKWAAENYMGDIQEVDCAGIKSFLITVTQANQKLDITGYR
jgi:hypothetical protein